MCGNVKDGVLEPVCQVRCFIQEHQCDHCLFVSLSGEVQRVRVTSVDDQVMTLKRQDVYNKRLSTF